jgi:hypothetical protein
MMSRLPKTPSPEEIQIWGPGRCLPSKKTMRGVKRQAAWVRKADLVALVRCVQQRQGNEEQGGGLEGRKAVDRDRGRDRAGQRKRVAWTTDCGGVGDGGGGREHAPGAPGN